jgi:predicted  nucleic acid-binding Zn-ribbon protein
MDADETADLLDELESLRRRVAELSEAVADARARRIHLEAVIARLKQDLRRAETSKSPPAY